MASKDAKSAKTPVVAAAAKEVKTVAETSAKETKTAAKAEAPKKEAVKKAAEKKAPAKKPVAKKTVIKTNLNIQFSGKEVSDADIVANVKKAWTSQFKGKLKDIKTIDIYVKPEEHRAYFVINGESTPDYFIEL